MTEETPFRILLVEDNEDHAELIMEILEDASARVDVRRCCDGEAALAHLAGARQDPAAHLPDLVLLDLDMPRMDGFQTLSAIKSDPRMRRIPVVILTTSRARQDVARALDGHANSYVCKTADFSALEALLAEVRRYWTRANLRPGPILGDAVGA
ncbi:response regulator [Albimonas pacifica]|uniref:Response regulator receiver domain-containing protein n=1 Tax=Albimonas pacifica TaxID=1114924 RepID=A0A1I3HVS3_9RHOB|nr:response regulator [Albimonas pacifica]SFI39677.1 Response regulator receiver domain-containing protein [Albimonas pacifica]